MMGKKEPVQLRKRPGIQKGREEEKKRDRNDIRNKRSTKTKRRKRKTLTVGRR